MGLLQRHSEIAELSSALQQAQEQIKKLSGDLQTRERELFHSNMRAEISEATKPVAKAQAELKASQKVESEKQRLETKRVQNSLANLEQTVNSNTGASS